MLEYSGTILTAGRPTFAVVLIFIELYIFFSAPLPALRGRERVSYLRHQDLEED